MPGPRTQTPTRQSPTPIPRLSLEAQAARAVRSPEPGGVLRQARLGAVAFAALVLVVAVAFGSTPTKIVACMMCLGLLQGLWRGASELVGLVAASMVALVLAPPVGRALEGAVGGVTGMGGVLNRMLAVGVVAVVVVAIGAGVIGVFARRALKARPVLARWNSLAGGALGLVEGVILGMAVLWTGLALEPIAAPQADDPAESSTVAKGVKRFAENVRGSALGGFAQATNPIEGSRLLSLAGDFVAVSRDEAAMEFFMSTPVMQEIGSLPSVAAARDRVHNDPQLRALLEEEGVTTGTIRMILESPTVLAIFDETTVVRDLAPRGDALVRAIGEAKARIGTRPAGPD